MNKRVPLVIGLSLLVLGLAAVCRKPLKRWWRAYAQEVSTGRFQDPEGLAVDSAGTLYVADEDWCRFTVLDPQGNTMAMCQIVDGYLVNGKPAPITTGDSMVVLGPGHVLLIARFNLAELRIQPGKHNSKISLVRVFGDFGDPEGIARDPTNGDVYVTDEDNRAIKVFGTSGNLLRSWAVAQDPEGICVTRDRVYVTFSKDDLVRCYDKDGELRFRFGEPGTGPGQFRNPDYVCVSPDGLLYVTDQKNHRIQVFDAEGKYRRTIGGHGTEPGRFREPEDLAFDPEGHLVVADAGNHRIQVLTRDGKFVRLFE